MKVLVAKENQEAEKLIPPQAPDGSGIGVNYIDAYIKPINTSLENGTALTCRRKGLKIILTIDDKTGEAIIRRAEHGPDVRDMLRKALQSAAKEADAKFIVEGDGLYLEM